MKAERPSTETIAYYEAALPADARAERGQMFGHPCAFVNGNMFFGTFQQTVVVRVGAGRAAELAEGQARIFEPMPARAWKEYVQVDVGAMAPQTLARLAREALEFADKLPPKKTRSARAATPSPGKGPGKGVALARRAAPAKSSKRS